MDRDDDYFKKIRADRLAIMTTSLSKIKSQLRRTIFLCKDLNYEDSSLMENAKKMVSSIDDFNRHQLIQADATLVKQVPGIDHHRTIPDTQDEE